MLLDNHAIVDHLTTLEQTVLGAVVIALLGALYYLLRHFVKLANHQTTQLKDVVETNTRALVKMESSIERNSRVIERFERKLPF